MFEAAEVGNKLKKSEYKELEPRLRVELLKAQERLATSKISVVLLISGAEGAGKGRLVNTLMSWMDARGIEVHAMWQPTDEEKQRPGMWRFWRFLPSFGQVAVFFGSWYTNPIINRVFGKITEEHFDHLLHEIKSFENMLYKENMIVIKLWMHLSKQKQKERLENLESDPEKRWRVTPLDWKFFKKYREFHLSSEHALRNTNTAENPWHIIESSDKRYRTVTAAQIIIDTINHRIDNYSPAENIADHPEPPGHNIINQLDLTLAIEKDKYEKKIEK